MDVQSDNSQPERPINERLKTSARRVLILSYIAVFFYSPAFLYIGFFAKDHPEYRKAGIICCVAYCCSALLANTCIYILARQAFYNVPDGTDNRSAYICWDCH